MGRRLELPWLRRPPVDFRKRCTAAIGADAECGTRLAELAGHGLDINQLHSLARALNTARAAHEPGTTLPGFKPLRLAILSNATTKLLAPCLAATGLRHGLDVTVIEGAFGQVLQEALDPGAPVWTARPDIVLLALDHRGIPGLAEMYRADEESAVVQAMNYIRTICDTLKKRNVWFILQSVPTSPELLFGNREGQIHGARRRRIELFNAQLATQAVAWGALWLDTAALAAAVGHDRWFDKVRWHHARLSFAQDAVPIYADHVLRLIATAAGRLSKCLVLDLDNTLWGGIIGDDGLDGIVLGQGSAEGEAFLSIQRTALALRQRGIILAGCSKNDEETARQPFRHHPDMVLREEHIAVFLANWRDKATNIQAIASALEIGVDSLVFLDDNPAERQQVRDTLPTVCVPELPADPALYPRTLLAAGYFETLTFTPEDSTRAEQYQANARRALEASNFRDLDGYLRSLAMVITFAPFDAVGRSRVVQLIARSNQFNLTTRRYTAACVEAVEKDRRSLTLQVRLADKFGDAGMISVIICRPRDGAWEIDTWLMSCRVLNRKVELAVLTEIVARAQSRGISRLIGVYRPTGRNGLVKDHYASLGFQLSAATPDQEEWTLMVADHTPADVPMTIHRAPEMVPA